MFSVHVGHEFVCLKFEKCIRNVVLLHLFPTRMVLEGLFGARSFILKDYRMLCTVAPIFGNLWHISSCAKDSIGV